MESKELLELYRTFKQGRAPFEKTWKLIDAYDSGKFWETLKAKLASHQLLPETNYINFIKTAYTNAVYSGDYMGTALPRAHDHAEGSRLLNKFIEHTFDKLEINYYKLLAGERAALLNVGAIQVGWDNDVVDGVYKKHKGEAEVKFIDTMSLYLDPAMIDYQKGRAVIISDEVSIEELKMEPRFKESVEEYLKKNNDNLPPLQQEATYYGKERPTAKDNIVRLLTIYYKEDGKLNLTWMLEDGFILDEKEDIRPRRFPVIPLYANPPIHDPYGASSTKLVLSNVLTINMLDSIEATYTYSSINRTKLVARDSGLNLSDFAKHGNSPNKVFLVNGRPEDNIKYVDLPQLHMGLKDLRERIERSIFLVTGVDLKYIGQDTASVTTTGGMEALQAGVQMRDNIRIKMLEKFVKDLTHLIVDMYKEHSIGPRQFPVRTNTGELFDTMEIDFNELKEVEFDYTLDVGPYLPKNRARLAEAANAIMEMQMQYQMDPPLITPEEWLMWQDFPQKDLILDRIKADRMHDDVEEIMSDITSFSALTQQGMDPNAAVEMLGEERQMKRQAQGMKLGNANTVQNRQAGGQR